MSLNEKNIEIYLFRYKEGLLDAAEAAEVERALATHPEWQEMADLYDPELTLPAGATMPYANADSLRDGGPKAGQTPVKISLRDEEPKHRRVMPLWMSVAAAACLLLFVTTLIKIVNFDGSKGVATVAGLTVDDSIVYPEVDSIAAIETIIQSTTDNVVRERLNDAPVFLADAVETNVENVVKSQPGLQPETKSVIAQDTNVYQLDNPTLREVNDPMDQEVLYANIIDWKSGRSETSENPSRRRQLRSIARKATSIIATATSNYEEQRDNLEDAIEERIQSNSFVNNLIATIE